MHTNPIKLQRKLMKYSELNSVQYSMRYSIYNIQYSTHLMKYALKSIKNEKRRKFSENSNNTKYAHEMQTNHHTAYKAYFMATTGEGHNRMPALVYHRNDDSRPDTDIL